MNFEIIHKSWTKGGKHGWCIAQGVERKPTVKEAVKRVKVALAHQGVPTYRIDSNSILEINLIS